MKLIREAKYIKKYNIQSIYDWFNRNGYRLSKQPSEPWQGAQLIDSNGYFLNLKGDQHLDLLQKMIIDGVLKINKKEVKLINNLVYSDLFEELGYIRCNGNVRQYAYISLPSKPVTEKQKEALGLWLAGLNKDDGIDLVYQVGNTVGESLYFREIDEKRIFNTIDNFYNTGNFPQYIKEEYEIFYKDNKSNDYQLYNKNFNSLNQAKNYIYKNKNSFVDSDWYIKDKEKNSIIYNKQTYDSRSKYQGQATLKDMEDYVKQKFGYAPGFDFDGMGSSYILSDGTCIYVNDYEGKFRQRGFDDFPTHQVVEYTLKRKFKDQYKSTRDLPWIRFNDGRWEEDALYITLPLERFTSAQENTLMDYMDYCFQQNDGFEINTNDYGQYIYIDGSDYDYDPAEVMKVIHKYYNTGKLEHAWGRNY